MIIKQFAKTYPSIIALKSTVYLILFSLFLIQKSFACNVVLAVSNNFPPYHMKTPDGSWSGVSVDLAKLLVKNVGCELSIINVPWLRSISLLRQGKVHLMTNFTLNDERAQFAQFLGPHHIEKPAFIARLSLSHGVYNLSRINKFKGVVAVTRGNSFGQEFDQYVLNDPKMSNKLILIRNNVDRYSLLLNGRIDGMFDDELSAQYLLKGTNKENELFDIRFTLEGNPVYFGVSPIGVSPPLREKLNQAWAKLLKELAVVKLYEKYNLSFDEREFNSFKQKQLTTESPIHPIK